MKYEPSGAQVARNGLVDAGGASFLANMAVLQLRDPAVVNAVVAAGGRPGYGAKMFPVPATAAQLPLIMIDDGEYEAAAATKTVLLAGAQADPVLHAIQQQAGVPEDQMVRAFMVSAPSAPIEAVPSRTRSTIVIIAAGAVAAILVGVILDVILMRRKARRQDRKSGVQDRKSEVQALDTVKSVDDTANLIGTQQSSDDAGKVDS
ncbi:hypothetical protein [Mycobacterium sp. OTB74]|uniref:hypothetical protein n=1 Tax=Mycobacterium sp. OTB74 TaxID=1853452 RepID=UPI002475CB7B|nr:hypothetical protein [Mycobacterium sp. OTB74]